MKMENPADSASADSMKREATLRLLVAEDTEMNRQVMVMLLEQLGIQADTVADGIQALEASATRTYAMILMDCQMPRMDGYTAAIEIRARGGLNATTPIIAMSGDSIGNDPEKCFAAGMNDCLLKPISIVDLESTLAKWGAPTVNWKTVEPFEDFFPKLVDAFSRNAPKKIQTLQEAIECADFDRIAREAHGLKSSAAYLGAERMIRMCDVIESRAKMRDFKTLSTTFAGLQSEYARVVERLSARAL